MIWLYWAWTYGAGSSNNSTHEERFSHQMSFQIQTENPIYTIKIARCMDYCVTTSVSSIGSPFISIYILLNDGKSITFWRHSWYVEIIYHWCLIAIFILISFHLLACLLSPLLIRNKCPNHLSPECGLQLSTVEKTSFSLNIQQMDN